MYKIQDYPVTVFYSKDDNGFVAILPDCIENGVSFVSAFGNTPEEAVREIQQAGKMWLEYAQEHQQVIPEPYSKTPTYYAMAA
jgi:predicted RNase H-like HicB family nuclease